ncbi:MAG: helix-turn-helix transcriptional regulator [Oscillospiraceae bacterium]|nr:helix-turn-helix transcriptional regulator [Oscillospiraceae bacterium]MBQ7054404.1 helix-turn-helix transcriptional regulator [Oscillospiraceae bacterium]
MFKSLRNIKLYTLIRTEYRTKYSSDDNTYHWHDYYQFVYVRKGEGVVFVKDEELRVSENDVVIIKRNEPHTFACFGDKLETYEVKFIIIDEEKDFLNSGERYFCRDTDGSIKHAIRQIERESENVDGFSRDVVSVEMCKILLLMQREMSRSREMADIKETQDVNEVNDDLLEKVKSFIDNNISENITVKDVSDYVCVEYKYFSHHFALRYGMRLKQYIRRNRVELAKELIVNSDMNMTAIAEKCGFGTIHYMTRVFKNEENISPTEFRRRFKNSHAVMLDAAPASYYPGGIEE